LADFMRRFGLCEQKGSGIDKVIEAVERFQLPAPEFLTGELRTTAILYAHRDFEAMSKPDRIRACYQHCCLMFVSRQRMSNQSLRQRFGLTEEKTAIASQVIAAAKAAELIRSDDTDSSSTRYARYLPYWA
jgi:ATP-dependent DNA helicase RecG